MDTVGLVLYILQNFGVWSKSCFLLLHPKGVVVLYYTKFYLRNHVYRTNPRIIRTTVVEFQVRTSTYHTYVCGFDHFTLFFFFSSKTSLWTFPCFLWDGIEFQQSHWEYWIIINDGLESEALFYSTKIAISMIHLVVNWIKEMTTYRILPWGMQDTSPRI